MNHTERTTTNSGSRTRQTCGFFVPVSQGQIPPVYGRVDRAEYKTFRGNKPSRLLAVVETRLPFSSRKPPKLNQQEAYHG